MTGLFVASIKGKYLKSNTDRKLKLTLYNYVFIVSEYKLFRLKSNLITTR